MFFTYNKIFESTSGILIVCFKYSENFVLCFLALNIDYPKIITYNSYDN